MPPAAEGLAFWLPLTGAAVIALAVVMYVIVDGFDLGVGILFPFAREESWRDRMMLSVSPVWDGNETWLVLGGVGLFALFDVAYAIIMPAVYAPVLVMLIALVFRGVSFEFRFKAERSRPLWDRSFFLGSLVATFAQGCVLGAFVQGFTTQDQRFAGGPFDWLTPFSLLTGLGLVAGYALLGATWCVMKTTGELASWARRMARRALPAVALAMAAVSLWTPLLDAEIRTRWFSWPNLAWLAPVPLLTAAAFGLLWRALGQGGERAPFFLSIALFLLGFVGLAASLFPMVVPPDLSIWDAANTPKSQLFLLAGFAVAVPATFAYNAYSYWVFRGKVGEDAAEAYHL
ncbi:MAG: cytochrome d ubiquinol oxidase subunit II [Phenylobacterium sp.]|uniref:cytochrome d ubiquinol oxidase subunit II n=1 Tax=Phenylobacterium sp. TaxID=1871053 RepID=UPI00391D4D12